MYYVTYYVSQFDENVNNVLRKTCDYDNDAMRLVRASTGFESKYYFKGIVYQGPTKLDAVASSLMAVVKKILNGLSFKRQSKTVMPTSRVALPIFLNSTV